MIYKFYYCRTKDCSWNTGMVVGFKVCPVCNQKTKPGPVWVGRLSSDG